MKTIIGRLAGMILITSAMIALAGCSKDVALPMSSILVEPTEILSTTMEADFEVQVRANCDWAVSMDASAAEWLSVSPTEGFGNATLVISVTTNTTSDMRTAVITVAGTGSDASATITMRQPAATGNITVSDIRMLKTNLPDSDSEYVITDDWRLSAVVNTVATFANLPDIAFGVQDSKNANSGIMVSPMEPLWKEFGTEIEISLQNATLAYGATGVLELRPVSDDRITETETSTAQINPVAVTYEQFMSGDYESMYVALQQVQVFIDDLAKTMEGSITVQDNSSNLYTMYTYDNASFYGNAVPTGSGDLSGIASMVDGDIVLLPMSASDFALTGPRFGVGNGITLPYVLSLKAKGPSDSDGMYYNAMRMQDGSNWDTYLGDPPALQIIEPNDGTGVNITFYKRTASDRSRANGGVRSRVQADAVISDIMSMQMWDPADGTDYAYALFEFPVAEPISGTVYLSYCMGASNYAPQKWAIQYSTDRATWIDSGMGDALNITYNVRNVQHFYTVPIVLNTALQDGSLYIRLIPTSYIRVNDTTGNGNEGGELRMNSALVLQQPDGKITSFPSGAIYTDGFDRIFGGVDYLLGESICNMAIHSGADIGSWDAQQRAGLTGENVNERPGYVQIGHVDYQAIDPRNYVNNVGQLTTPALSSLTAPTDVTVTFKAMAYRSANGATLYANNSNSTYPDKDGDKTTLRIEVLGAGTINGYSYADLTGMSYAEFREFSAEIAGATSDTQIKFTSTAASGEFTRWFLDDVAVFAGDPSTEPDPAYGDPDTPGPVMPETDPHIID